MSRKLNRYATHIAVGAPYANRYLGSAFNEESACEKVTDAVGIGNLGGTTDAAAIRPKFLGCNVAVFFYEV